MWLNTFQMTNLRKRYYLRPMQIGLLLITLLLLSGYDYWGSFDKCAEIGNKSLEEYKRSQKLPETLIDLRTSLFFEQRRWRHFGYEPDRSAMEYIQALVAAIRQKIIAGISD